MNKFIPLIVLSAVLIIGGLLYFQTPPLDQNTSTTTPSQEASKSTAADNDQQDDLDHDSALGGTQENHISDTTTDKDDMSDAEDKHAVELYKTSDDALKAAKDAANDYDDLVLEQFTNMPDDCSWCDSFYKSVKDLMFAPDTKKEQRSYFAELLAVSGKLENVQTLVDAIKNAPDSGTSDLYAEALELTSAKDKDEIVNYLGTELTTTNSRLKEAAVAAITSQGSPIAADLLYKHTVEAGDPDGYYSLGIGLGELVPDEKTLPVLQEMAMKRDQYSHLAIKALLNGGLNGVRTVFDILENSPNPEADRALLKNGGDHVSYEDGIEDVLKKVIDTSKNPVAVETAKEWLAGVQADSQEEGDGTNPVDVLGTTITGN